MDSRTEEKIKLNKEIKCEKLLKRIKAGWHEESSLNVILSSPLCCTGQPLCLPQKCAATAQASFAG